MNSAVDVVVNHPTASNVKPTRATVPVCTYGDMTRAANPDAKQAATYARPVQRCKAGQRALSPGREATRRRGRRQLVAPHAASARPPGDRTTDGDRAWDASGAALTAGSHAALAGTAGVTTSVASTSGTTGLIVH